MKLFIKKNGSISLTTVLMVSSILLASGLTLVISTVDLSLSTKSFNSQIQAKSRAKTCLEESLYKISKMPSYTGTVNFSYTDGSCSSTIQNDTSVSTTKIVTTNSNIDVYNYTEIKKVDTTQTPLVMTN